MKQWEKEQVTVFECKDRKELGSTASADFSKALIKVLEKIIATVVFAAAPSQHEFLAAIVADKSIDFSRIRAFNLDEYIGLSVDSPETFGNFLRRSLYSLREFNKVEFLTSESPDPEKEAKRYAGLLAEQPIDIVCMGIGENGHLAFNDPPVADFNDPKADKVVELELPCSSQQVNDGCFPTIEDVPQTCADTDHSYLGKCHLSFLHGTCNKQSPGGPQYAERRHKYQMSCNYHAHLSATRSIFGSG